MAKYLLSLVILFCSSNLFAQSNIPLESWRMHISYNSVIDVADGGDKVFAAVKNGVFYFDKEDNSLNTITKMDGLSDVSISSIAYSKPHEMLLIGYVNGNLDVWQNGDITNITTVLNASINGSKKMNHFNILGDVCYIATDFGVLRFSLNTLVIQESYQNLGDGGTALIINESTILNDSIYLATNNGVMATTLNPQVNILDFNNWKRYGFSNQSFSTVASFNGKLYAAQSNGEVYAFNNMVWQVASFSTSDNHNSLYASETHILLTSGSGVTLFDGTTANPVTTQNLTGANHSIIDGVGSIWIADSQNGLLTNKDGDFTTLVPEGPFSEKTSKAYYANGKIFVLPGGINTGGLPANNTEGFYVFENGFWTNYHPSEYPEIPDNLNDVVYSPLDNHYYFTSFKEGVLKYDGESAFSKIDNTNSSLETWPYNSSYIVTSGIAANYNGLYVTNHSAINKLHKLDPSGGWQGYAPTSIGSSQPMNITIADNGDKWITLDPNLNGKVVVFNETTGKTRLLDTGNGNGGLPTNTVNDIAIDKEGLVWLGTDRGVAYFTSTYAVDNGNSVDAILPIYDGFPLLRDESITCIAIDGGNRKWFGSDNGLWLFNENVQRLIYYFNSANSPLTSNYILDVAIHEKTGEVFIATDNGLVSFRSPATEGEAEHQKVEIFPNPVTADFQGMVGISGLAENAIVKITDVSGKLIRQMRANGGTAGWDVNDYNGRRAATGIYLVFSATDDGEESFVGKMAIIE